MPAVAAEPADPAPVRTDVTRATERQSGAVCAQPVPQRTPAFAYVRVSTEEQAAGGVSLAAQREAAEAYCRLHRLDLARIHADEGLSGRRADNRPGLQRAINDACAQSGILVVHALSRLARSTRDAIDLADRLAGANADLVSITERIDTTTSMGRFFFTTIAALAQLERDLISERTTAALAHKRSHGQRVSGRIPLGYDLAEDGVQLIENEHEQRVVQRIHDLRHQGLG
ncbi:MAG: recombinase family protein [Planctomycetes bacterium]|nr:recombinase family protein [Planctomycetota bacterium]